jgi:hypothetical protein
VGKSAPLKQNMEAAFRFEHQILLYNTCESRVSSKWSTLGHRLDSRKTCTSYIDFILSALLLNYCAEDGNSTA